MTTPFRLLLGATLICLIAYAVVLIGSQELLHSFALRLSGKAHTSVFDYQSRPWLMMQALRLWLATAGSFVFGPGIMTYSCSVDYCSAYRHPHNLFLLGFVWFGLLFVPFCVLLLRTLVVATRQLRTNSTPKQFVASLFLNYFLLAMVGGDFEQNRHLLFLAGALAALNNPGLSGFRRPNTQSGAGA